jgi:beta-galactosidase
LARKLDPSRLTIYAMNMQWIDICDIHAAAGFRFDIFGANYRSGQQSEHYDEFQQKYPDWPLIGTETYGGAATRGLFGPDKSHLPVQIDDRWLDGPERWRDEQFVGIASAYGGTSTPWGYSIEEAWLDCVKRPYMAGTFLWTGFDYRGETFPYDWPSVLSRFGVLDHCGFYKETTHYLRAWWRRDDPHIFIFPHWNWQGREGEVFDIWCYANSHTVELFLNGESLSRKVMPENFRLSWDVPYAPGVLEAKGYDAEGNLVASTARRTAGAPATVELKPFVDSVRANGEDIVVVEVTVVDKNGEFCPLADNTIEFGVEGPLEIIGVGNGDPLSHEPDTGTNQRRAYHGLCQVILRSTGEAGSARLSAGGWGLAPAEVEIEIRRDFRG